MKPTYVINSNNFPSNTINAVFKLAVIYLLLEHFEAPKWVYITLGIIYGISFLSVIIRNVTQTSVDLFEDISKTQITEAKKSFREKLNDLAKERSMKN